MDFFREELIIIDLPAENSDEVINRLAEVMAEKGYVTNDYALEVSEREKKYPTGLPTQEVKVAIPHAGADNVIQPGVAVAVLKQPVVFYNMENPDQGLDVHIVFLLANKDSGDQLKDLQSLTGLFADPSILQRVVKSGSAREIAEMLNHRISK